MLTSLAHIRSLCSGRRSAPPPTSSSSRPMCSSTSSTGALESAMKNRCVVVIAVLAQLGLGSMADGQNTCFTGDPCQGCVWTYTDNPCWNSIGSPPPSGKPFFIKLWYESQDAGPNNNLYEGTLVFDGSGTLLLNSFCNSYLQAPACQGDIPVTSYVCQVRQALGEPVVDFMEYFLTDWVITRGNWLFDFGTTYCGSCSYSCIDQFGTQYGCICSPVDVDVFLGKFQPGGGQMIIGSQADQVTIVELDKCPPGKDCEVIILGPPDKPGLVLGTAPNTESSLTIDRRVFLGIAGDVGIAIDPLSTSSVIVRAGRFACTGNLVVGGDGVSDGGVAHLEVIDAIGLCGVGEQLVVPPSGTVHVSQYAWWDGSLPPPIEHGLGARNLKYILSDDVTPRITAEGFAFFGGTLTIRLADSFSLTPPVVIPIISSAKTSGQFDALDLPCGIAIEYTPTGVNAIITALPPALPCIGDVNCDGNRDVLDLIDILMCFGQPAVPGCSRQDINHDGTVNLLDLYDLLLVFGQTCP